jgi:hypothetical protein
MQTVIANSENLMNHTEFKSKIFVPAVGFDWRISSSRLMYGGYLVLVIILLIASNLDLTDYADSLTRILSFSILGIIIFANFWGTREKEMKHGKLKGDLLLSLDYISVNDTRYSWSQLVEFKLGLFSVRDEKLWSETYSIAKYYGGPAYSQGVDNYIQIKTRDQRISIFFQLETPSHEVELRRIMRLLFFNDRLDFSTTYFGLNLEYAAIQEFKKAKIKYLEEKQFKVSQ